MEVITLEPDSRQYVQNINTQISLACIFKELEVLNFTNIIIVSALVLQKYFHVQKIILRHIRFYKHHLNFEYSLSMLFIRTLEIQRPVKLV